MNVILCRSLQTISKTQTVNNVSKWVTVFVLLSWCVWSKVWSQHLILTTEHYKQTKQEYRWFQIADVREYEGLYASYELIITHLCKSVIMIVILALNVGRVPKLQSNRNPERAGWVKAIYFVKNITVAHKKYSFYFYSMSSFGSWINSETDEAFQALSKHVWGCWEFLSKWHDMAWSGMLCTSRLTLVHRWRTKLTSATLETGLV